MGSKRKTVEATFVRPGDIIRVGGVAFEVTFSEPYSDYRWDLEGTFPDGYVTRINVPGDLRLQVTRPEA